MMSAASSDTFLDDCDGVDAVSGPVVIHLLMCVLVLNQH